MENHFLRVQPSWSLIFWLIHLLSHAHNLLLDVTCYSEKLESLWTTLSFSYRTRLVRWLSMWFSDPLQVSSPYRTPVSSLAKSTAWPMSKAIKKTELNHNCWSAVWSQTRSSKVKRYYKTNQRGTVLKATFLWNSIKTFDSWEES